MKKRKFGGKLVFCVDFYEKKKICLDMANMPQIAYNAGCCLTGHPSKYWISLSLLNFGNLVFSVDFYEKKKICLDMSPIKVQTCLTSIFMRKRKFA